MLKGVLTLSKSSSSFASGRQGVAAEAALLEELHGLVDKATLHSFQGCSELPTGATTEAENLLLRYLRAEKYSVPKAAKRLQAQAAWRRQFGGVTQEDVAAEVATGKVLVQLPCASSAGRPLLVVKAARHRANDPGQLQQFIYYCLETASSYCWDSHNPDGKLVAVFDLQRLQLKNLDASALRASFNMLNQHFPERVAHIFMLEAPAIFFGIWKVVEPFIDATARKKIRFVHGQAARATMLEVLGPDVLPLEYGGSTAEVPVELAAQQLASWRQQQGMEPVATSAACSGMEAGNRQEPSPLRLSQSSPTLPA